MTQGRPDAAADGVRTVREDLRVTSNRARPGQDGFALILVLFVLVGLTAMATAGFLVTDSEHQVSLNHSSNVHALNAASAGLYDYLGTTVTGTDTSTYAYTNATVTVFGEQYLDLGNNQELLRVTANAQYVSLAGDTASRTLNTLAVHSVTDGSFNVTASYASGTGINKNGGSGTISGYDQSSPGDCPGAGTNDVAGVAVPPGEYVQSGGTPVPAGNPDIDDSQSGLDQLLATGIDWPGLINGGGLQPDYTVPPDSWPDFGTLPASEWPLIYLTDPDFSIAASYDGRGVIVARHDVTMNGSFEWDGIMLVGGKISSNGYQQIRGATVTGLNLLLGETVLENDIGNGNKTFQYNSCNVLDASQALGSEIITEQPASLSERI